MSLLSSASVGIDRASYGRIALTAILHICTAWLVFFISGIDLPKPDRQWRVAEARFELVDEAGQVETTGLVGFPHEFPRRTATQMTGRYTITLDLPTAPHDQAVMVVSKYSFFERATVNGALLANEMKWRINRATAVRYPDLFVMPTHMLRQGVNVIELHLVAERLPKGFVSEIFVGPEPQVEPAFRLRRAIIDYSLMGMSSWIALLVLIVGILWWSRPSERVLGSLLGLLVANNLHTVSIFQYNFPVLTDAPPFAICLIAWECYFLLVFAMRLTEFGFTRTLRGLFVLPCVVTLLVITDPPAFLRYAGGIIFFFSLSVPLVLTYLIFTVSAMRRKRSYELPISVAALISILVALHEVASFAGLVAPNHAVMQLLAFAGIVIYVTLLMTFRFARSLAEADRFAERLAARVREVEGTLQQAFERERVQIETAALAEERSRIVRDLHDGMGGHLVSIVALSEQHKVDASQISRSARDAINEMRNVIDALDDQEGDIGLFLGTWKERVEAQLRPHDIALDWRVEDNLSIERLGPRELLELRRLLQEAVTNLIRHSRATSAIIRATALTPTGVQILISDNGHGFDLNRLGHGLRNMSLRAQSIGGELSIKSGTKGTEVNLRLRNSVVVGEASSGLFR